MLFKQSSSPLRVSGFNQPAKSFLDFSEWGSNSPGSTVRTSRKIGALGRSYDYSGDVGGKDLDHFQFGLSRTRDFRLTLSNDGSRNIIASLLDVKGRLITIGGKRLSRVVAPGAEAGFIVRKLRRGTYYVRLSSGGRNEDYDMKLETQSPA